MMTNLKLDIIYYKTSSDFELEFNLSGCCRMRIFKDKVDTPKELVTALARDVERSRIILIVSDLAGDKNGVEIVCSSIGYDYKAVDKAAYSIKNEEDIKAPLGSLPLVTKSGEYGGCILESGKQSIIIVSSDRTLRHEVMRLYIHQYIFDINQVEAFNERMRHESEHNPIIDGSNILSSARQEFAAVEGAGTVAEGVAVTIASGVSAPVSLPEVTADEAEVTADEAAEATAEAETEPCAEEVSEPSAEEVAATEEPVHQPKAEDDTPSENERDNNVIRSNSNGFVAMTNHFADEEEEAPILTKRHRRRRKGSNIVLLVITILLLICFGLLAYYLVYLPIMGGELPNDLVEILKEVLPWTE